MEWMRCGWGDREWGWWWYGFRGCEDVVEIRDEGEYFCVVAHEQVEFEDFSSLKV
jgi:hypothetical protein